MKKTPAFTQTSIQRATRILVISLASSSLTVAQAAVSLGTAPPVTKQAPEPVPNIILTLDDSGSMDWRLSVDAYRTGIYAREKSRMTLLKEAAKEAFTFYDNGKFRLAYQSINGTSGSGGKGFAARNFSSVEKRNLMKPFEGKHRADFLDWLDGLVSSGMTPLRHSVIKAGEYTMGRLSNNNANIHYSIPTTTYLDDQGYEYDGKFFRYDPLNGLDCRRSVHILMTDGQWNDRSWRIGNTYPPRYLYDDDSITIPAASSLKLYDHSTAEEQIPTPQSGSLGPNTSTVKYSTSLASTYTGFLYRDSTNLPTLADLTFNYWATDLRSDLDNNVRTKPTHVGDETFTYNGVSKTVPEWWNPRNNPAHWQSLQTYTIGFGPVAQLPELAKKDARGNTMRDSSGNIIYHDDPVNYMYTGDFFGAKITGQAAWPAASNDHANNRYDLWHAAYNGRGKFYAATSGDALKKAFAEILETATASIEGDAVVSANASSSRLTGDSIVYSASYSVNDGIWSGSLVYQKTSDYGNSGAGNLATASIPAASSRNILTWRDGVGGIPFRWADITSGLNDRTTPTLAELKLGNNANIVNALRAKPLGDIVNSSVALAGKPSNVSLAQSYARFAKKIASRTHMIYVGANDGMLHGFDAGQSTLTNPGTGQEKLAYVPRAMIRDLHKYLEKNYNHRYWVDGSPTISDMQIAAQSGESGENQYNGWRTVLTGTLGAGGKGYYMLDVTDPSKFLEANANSLVLVDNTFAANDTDADPDLGYQMHEPVAHSASLTKSGQVVQLNLSSSANPGQKQWGVIMGNGINSTNGKPVLLVQTLDGSQKTLHKIDACTITTSDDNAANCEALPAASTSTNGLMAPRPVDLNGDGTVDVVYAGDYQGNMWKFDLSSTNAADWKVGLGGRPLFTAKGLPEKTANNPATAYRQTITAAPTVIAHPKGGFMVAFGTGRNLNTGDQNDHAADQLSIYGNRFNTIYGIHDTQKFTIQTSTVGSGNTQSLLQTVVLDAATAAPVDSTVQGNYSARFASLARRGGGELDTSDGDTGFRYGATDSSGDLAAGQKGWYIDLPIVQLDNASKVLRNSWMMADNIISFFTTNVSSESILKDYGNSTPEESCDMDTSHTSAITQWKLFDVFTGKNPNIAIRYGNEVINASMGNVLQVDGATGPAVKGDRSVILPGGKHVSLEFSKPVGKFTGWRIIN